MTDRILTIPDLFALAAIGQAASGKDKVSRLVGDDIIEGTARSIGDDRGSFLAAGSDVRDAFLRVTTLAGWEAFWPVADLVEEHKVGYFVTHN